MTVGDNIRFYRQKKKLTQKQLGELCHIAESTIRRYELGKLNPKYETLKKIALALDIHPLVLLNQISEQLASELSTEEDNLNKAYVVFLKSIYKKVDIEQIRENGFISYNYILGEKGSEIIIPELTYDDLFESIEILIKTYISISKEDNDSQECYFLIKAISNMTLSEIRELIKYINFLNSKK